MLAKAIELGELAVEDPARALVNLYTWVTLDSEPKARSMAAMRAFDLPKESPRVTRDAIDWWVGRKRKTIEVAVDQAHQGAQGAGPRRRGPRADHGGRVDPEGARRRSGAGAQGRGPVRPHLSLPRRSSHAGAAELVELERWARETAQLHRAGVHRRRPRRRVPAQPGLRPDHPARRAAREAHRPPGRAEHRCPQAPDRGQPAPGGQHRQEVHRPRHELPGPHPGGQHRPHPGGREVRLREGLQVQHLRDVVDPAGDHARHRRPGAHDPHPGPHGGDHQPPDPRQPHPAPGAGPRADRGGDRAAHEPRRDHPRAARQAPA